MARYIIPAIDDECTQVLEAGNTELFTFPNHLELSYRFRLKERESRDSYEWEPRIYDSELIIKKSSITHIASYFGHGRQKYCINIHIGGDECPAIVFESKEDCEAMFKILVDWFLY